MDSFLLNILDFSLIIKIIILILLGMYCIFACVTYINIRSLRNIIVIKRSFGSPLINTLALLYVIVAVSLFVAALAIL